MLVKGATGRCYPPHPLSLRISGSFHKEYPFEINLKYSFSWCIILYCCIEVLHWNENDIILLFAKHQNNSGNKMYGRPRFADVGYCVNSGGISWIAAVMGHQAGYVGPWLHGNLSETMLDTECRKQCLYIDLQWIDFFFNLFCHAKFSKVYLGYLIQKKEPDSSIQAGLTYVIWVHLPPCEAISITAGLIHRCGILLSLVITMSR